jgi:peptidoglycan/xylan/chitin deacetylase (PgdA/CDA1 family)
VLLAALGIGVALALGGSARGGRHRLHLAPRSVLARVGTLAGAGSGSFAALERGVEARAVRRALVLTPYVRIAGRQHRELALTFDDGPGPYTPEVLGVLERMHAAATFFEVGEEDRYFHASTARIVADGFPIGDHTETHPAMSRLSRRDQLAQLQEQARTIGAYGAPPPDLFRPPYGVWSDTTLALLHRLGMLMVLWTVDTNDYLRPGTKAIVAAAVDGARPGAIILLHDAGGNRSQTITALPIIIRELRRRRYALVTVPRLLLDNPPPRDQDLAGLSGGG